MLGPVQDHSDELETISIEILLFFKLLDNKNLNAEWKDQIKMMVHFIAINST